MSRFLCIEVTLLDPLFHGKGDDEQAEWPPSPMRLFQALVAGSRMHHRGRGAPIAIDDAFAWLQKREAPYIICPPERRLLGYDFFVPRNEPGPRQDRLTGKCARPHQVLEEGPLRYLWPISEDEWPGAKAHVETLCREARQLLALGWGIDVAFANGRDLSALQVAALTGVRWKPWRGFSSPVPRHSRVPKEGSLRDLEAVYRSFLASVDTAQNLYCPPQKFRAFDEVTYLPVDSLPPRPSGAFLLESTGGDERQPRFPQNLTTVVAAMLRSRACGAAQDDPHWEKEDAAKYVAGHAGGAEPSLPRFSYLPLPSIGHPHADGLIRRVLIAEPYGASGNHVRWARSRLNHSALLDEHTRKPQAVLSAMESRDGVLDAYLGRARNWFSVTPVLLPGLDDHKHDKAEKLLIKAIAQAGIDFSAVAEFGVQKAPFWHGSLHPRQYQPPSHLRHLPRWHVRLVFREAIEGPLSIGAGRHCGLGLFGRGA